MPYKRNESLWYAQGSLANMLLLVSSGAIFQSFLIQSGLTNDQVGIATTVIQVVQAIVMLAASGFIDRVKNMKRMYALTTALSGAAFLPMLLFLNEAHAGTSLFFPSVLIICAAMNLFWGLRSIISYKLPYLAINMKEYGRFTVMECIITAVYSVVFSFAAARLTERLPFSDSMRILFLVSASGVFAASLLILRLRVRVQPEEASAGKQRKTASLARLFRDRRFSLMLLPNLLRGVANGIFGMLAVFAANDIGADAAFLSRMAFVSQAAAFAAYAVYRILIGKISSKAMCLTGTMIFCLLPLLAFAPGKSYLWAYFIICIGLNFFSVAIPVIVADKIPYEIIGGYTSWRMLLMTGGTALGSLISGYAIGHISSFLLLSSAAAMQLICGIAYWFFPKEKALQ